MWVKASIFKSVNEAILAYENKVVPCIPESRSV